MKVKFKQHFGGRETGEIHYEPGEFVDLDAVIAEDLLKRGVCEVEQAFSKPEEAKPEVEEKPKKAVKK